MEGDGVALACLISGILFAILGLASFSILWAVNWRPWRIYSWIFARKWPSILQGPQLGMLCALLSLVAWAVVLSPVVVLIMWGCWLIIILGRDIVGLAVIMAGIALLLAFYSIMLWWRTRWQSSRAVAFLLLLAVALLCAYELCAVYVTAGSSASERYSPSGFFFGVSAIALAINMLFICRMVFNGNGLDVDEYVRRAYKFAYSDSIEMGPVSCLPEPPDPNELYPREFSRASHLGLLYLGSLVVLLVYSILYGLTAKDAHWLGAITSAAVIILDWNMGACLYGFQLLKSRVVALFVAGTTRVFLICFGVHYWYLGHCISYAVVASVLLGAAVSRHFSATNPLAARRDALQSTVIRLREGFRRKEQNSSSSSSDGCGSSIKRSSSVEGGHSTNIIEGSSQSMVQCSDANNWNSLGYIQEGINSDKSVDSGRPSLAMHNSSHHSVVQENEVGTLEKNIDPNSSLMVCSSSGHDSQGCESSTSTSANQQMLDLNLALALQERLSDPRITSMLKRRARHGDRELTSLLQDKGLDPNFAMMLKEKSLDPTILALLQRSSLDADRDHRDNTDVTIVDSNSVDNAMPNQISLSEELRLQGLEKWLKLSRLVLHHIASTPERAWVLFSFVFIIETIIVAVFRPKTIKIINATHQQFEFGFAVLLLSPVVCSIMAFIRSLQGEETPLTPKPRRYGFVAWLLSTSVGLLLSFLSKSSVLLGLSLTVPLIVACLSVAIPIWIRNGYQFWVPQVQCAGFARNHRHFGTKEVVVLTLCIAVFAGSVLALGAIVSVKPLDDLRYKGLTGEQNNFTSPYASSAYLGWAMASAVALAVTGVLPIVSWFATYRFSLSSAICVSIFSVVLVAFCGASYLKIVKSRDDQVPTAGDFLAAFLPLVCIPALLSLCSGLLKWKDDGWKLSRGVYVFVTIGLLLLLAAISAVIVVIKPWTIGAAFLLLLLLIVLAIGVIHHWASNNFYLTRTQMFLVCFLSFLLGLAAFFVGWFQDKPFIGASVGYFSFLFLLAGRALTVLLSPPIVVYSPRVLPVYVYDAHADCGKNVSAAFLVLYGIALATEGWGVVASLTIYPPYAGAAVSAVTLVVAFGFAVSRPCLTLKMMEDAVHFLSKDTVVQAISRSATKTRNALSGTYSAPQRSASSAALLVGDPAATLDKGGNFVLPRDDVMKLRDRLRNEELVAGSFFHRMRYHRGFRHEPTNDVDYRREMCAHARILALEEAIDTEWVYMWDKFGGYLLLLLGLTAKAERVQDEVRLNLFLDSIGFSDLSAKKIKKWMPEDRRQFEIIQESYIREKEMEEEILMQRREEEGRGKERRKALLEKEERKWKEIEASLISSIPNAGSREAAAMAAAVRAVGGDSVLEDSFARERVSSIARRIRTAQLARRAVQTGLSGAVCILDDEPTTSGRHCGQIDPSMCQSQKVSFSVAVMIQPESGPVCLLGTEFQKKVCWEILVAGSEQGIEAGQVGLRLITKGDRQTTVAKEWSISATSIADGRWHTVTMTIDADIGEATCYLDGGFDGYQTSLPLFVGTSIWEQGTEVWVGVRPPIDMDAFGRSDSEGAESKMHIMDVFLWGRCLNEDEVASLHTSICSTEFNLIDFPEDNWHWADSPPRVDEWDSDPADVDLYDRDDVDWDGQYSSGRKRRSEREGFVVHVDSFARRYRKPRIETQEEINQRMLSVELAVKEALSARGEMHFTDNEFPPNDQSLFIDPRNPPSKLQVVSEWMRPTEIVKGHLDSHPCLFSGAANPSDVCQGRLGDCWFLSAVAVLTEVSQISEVIITPEYNEEGIYTVRFCIQGEWVPVVVDDWIPCESPGKPAFATSRKGNELWVSILEKAYAKLHGSYEALEGGLVQDALVDLTGGAGEEIDMRSPQAQIDLASGRLWSQLLRFKQEGFLLGAGSPSGSDVHISSSGIVQGHAYSLLQVREVDGHKLVQIRNPWANEVEWNGPWSDSSSEWTDRMRHKLKHVSQSKDGIFWMSWQDFQIHFRSIYVCRVYPPEMRYSVHGQWRGYSAGGCQDYNSWHQNPQFRLRASGPDASYPIHVFITLTQGVSFSRTAAGFRNYQSSHDSQMFYIGMRILKTRGRRAAYNIYLHESVGGTDYVNSREISCEMVLEPEPKGYTIVPTTIHPGEEAPFVLSVFTKASVVLEPL
ncbi:calpain-type cysteine protease DEK1 [Gossypium arboreum]|uniref:calpain-type cysteine protease DEK1 n=1 Tax=Gossypium arboreum TaxID=29729 RepID=UPI00081927DE|nr:calpain-type cysteine protease DEK1 [Gossypium arboreum]XP_052882370.1 calpain-type cysteine protease DEK1 [Gossypium arboreum]XP_052882371.1 calpain-type cysteine protease DEK1 [Gossypium arboreum]XP_052882372.1 calpain-type cysteine protease DEK1 [Gossypium arboreum]XP_052882373.1 calpain-type cysteine protease DEK1 [Gossypium arboreum]XP_052882374.1 calpain-type cysteine protease DEK1 [Gossypium arboreum]